ncbi:MAG: hypothetical protein Q4A82_06015 [Corynebacterium sp.]|nr:hypothetical protein [Corynebacterium sp.]
MLLNFDDERLTPRQKRKLRNGAASWAMAGMPLTDINIDRMVQITLGLMTEEEAIAEVKEKARRYKAEQQES